MYYTTPTTYYSTPVHGTTGRSESTVRRGARGTTPVAATTAATPPPPWAGRRRGRGGGRAGGGRRRVLCGWWAMPLVGGWYCIMVAQPRRGSAYAGAASSRTSKNNVLLAMCLYLHTGFYTSPQQQYALSPQPVKNKQIIFWVTNDQP